MLRPILVAALLAPLSLHAQERFALLVGNSDYDLPEMDLGNPVNDANALAVELSQLGFQVKPIQNATRADMEDGLAWLTDVANGAEIAVVFFAGHGVQIAGENYLIGRDLAHNDLESVVSHSLTLREIRSGLFDAGADLGLIIMDACRNNPFSESDRTPPGLAVQGGASGLLIAYSTDPGNVALDIGASADHSPYSDVLLSYVAEPNLDVADMLSDVQTEVIMRTNGAQNPWIEGTTDRPHYLGGRAFGQPAPVDDEFRYWSWVQNERSVGALKDYLARYPNGDFASVARREIDDIDRARENTQVASRSLPAIDPEDRSVLKSVLNFMGFTKVSRGVGTEEDPPELLFRAWQGVQSDPDTATQQRLLEDAATRAVFLAAATSLQIRSDLRALSATRKVEKLAADDLASLRQLAAGNPDASAYLVQAEADMSAIRANRRKLEARLAATKRYYQRLLELAHANFPDLVSADLLKNAGPLSSGLAFEANLARDAAFFVEQVALLDTRPRGSVGWLADIVRNDPDVGDEEAPQ
ncbi:MAG: caspase family protein [Rhodobacteraceae bacterium]|nr:caspase family protein [Paracoccaceae bacterium]